MSNTADKPFLTAEWRNLVVLNYPIDPQLLRPHLPARTELDLWNSTCYVSLVAFYFKNTRIRGIPIPFHRHFEEINLRFYVRRKVDGIWQRGVTFIKELVPRRAIAMVARRFYNENYFRVPMSHSINLSETGGSIAYRWAEAGASHEIRAEVSGGLIPLEPDSEPRFILEHYWGYTRQRDGTTLQYRVDHPPWRIWQTARASITCDFENVYGPEFAPTLAAGPASAFVAEGSPISVYSGTPVAQT